MSESGSMPAHVRRRTGLRRVGLGAFALGAAVAVIVGVGVAVATGGRHPVTAHPTASRQLVGTTTTTTLPPPPTTTGADGVTATWVQAENAKPGTADWRIGAQAGATISGYADHTSAVDGQAVGLYVSTPAPSFTATAYRMGWYGGTGGRQVWASATTPGAAQAPCPVTPSTYMVSCTWTRSLTVPVTSDWPQGDYLIKLTATGGQSSYVPLTVTDPTTTATYVVLNSVLTWQAWNDYGGHSCFAGAGGQQGPTTADRARVVSFDRPYAAGDGASDFIGLELPVVEYAERLGLDVSYLTDIDLTDEPQLAARHRALLSLGHNEFWSAPERTALLSALQSGVNLAFLGATAGLRPARLQPSPLGPDREEVAYRDAAADPIDATQPDLTTANEWSNPPLDKPNFDITGQAYGGYGINGPFVITDPGAWVYAGLGAAPGTQLPGVVGGDYDHYTAGQGPADVRIFASSPVHTSYGVSSTATMTYYTAPSGAGVMATGSIAWVGFLACPSGIACVDVQGITANVLRAFGTGPAGRDPATAAS